MQTGVHNDWIRVWSIILFDSFDDFWKFEVDKDVWVCVCVCVCAVYLRSQLWYFSVWVSVCLCLSVRVCVGVSVLCICGSTYDISVLYQYLIRALRDPQGLPQPGPEQIWFLAFPLTFDFFSFDKFECKFLVQKWRMTLISQWDRFYQLLLSKKCNFSYF